jgi:hypothetical protein
VDQCPSSQCPRRERCCGNGARVEPVRHRQTKGAATDMFGLQPPRHTPNLPIRAIRIQRCNRPQSTLCGHSEKLHAVHGITPGRETLRLWMIEAELWIDRKQRHPRYAPENPREVSSLIGRRVTFSSGAYRTCVAEQAFWKMGRGYFTLFAHDDKAGIALARVCQVVSNEC